MDQTQLTFNSPNPDLQYFEVGDVVQKGSGLVELDTSNTNKFTNPENAFDDNEDTYAEVIADDTNSFLHFTIAPGITSITCVIENTNMTESNAFYIQSGDGGHANSGTWTVTNGYTVSGNQITVPANSGKVRLTFELPADANVGRYYPHRGRAGFRIYNTPDASIPPASITAIDTAANTMTVDGGDWIGIDGSGGDGRYLPSQEWSSYNQGGANATTTSLFDGDTSTYGGYECDITIPEGSRPSFTKIEVMFDTGNDFGNVFAINGVDTVPSQGGKPGSTWIDVTSIVGAGDLSTIVGSGTGRSITGPLGIRLNGFLLVDGSIPGGGRDTFVTGSTETAEGTIQSVEGTEVDLSASSGRWIANNKAGIPFSFVPSTPIVDTKNEAYGKLQIINDKAQVTGIQATDPGFLNVTAKDYSIQFPSVFATGNAPDVDLPAGCAISAIVKAENGAGASVKESNVLLPQTPNPEGSAGPITDVEGGGENVYTTDTIASVASADYSSLATTSDGKGFRPANPPSNAFDGNESTSCLSLNEGSNKVDSLIFPLNISNVSKLEVRPVASGSTVTMNAGADDATHSAMVTRGLKFLLAANGDS